MAMEKKLSSRDWGLISAYLDDELNPREKARVEEYLQVSKDFQEALTGLQRTRAILQKTPRHRVPRNFTLTADQVQPARVPRWTSAMRWSSAVAALAAVILFAYQFLPALPGLRAVPEQTTSEFTMEAAEMPAPTAAAAEAPQIIYWGGLPDVYGMGGGMGGGSAGAEGSGDVKILSVSPSEQMPFPQPPLPNPLPDLQPQQPQELRTFAAPAEPLGGTGPVLGIRPPEVQGQVLPQTAEGLPAREETGLVGERQSAPWLLVVAGGLLALAVGLFIAATIIRRKAMR